MSDLDINGTDILNGGRIDGQTVYNKLKIEWKKLGDSK